MRAGLDDRSRPTDTTLSTALPGGYSVQGLLLKEPPDDSSGVLYQDCGISLLFLKNDKQWNAKCSWCVHSGILHALFRTYRQNNAYTLQKYLACSIDIIIFNEYWKKYIFFHWFNCFMCIFWLTTFSLTNYQVRVYCIFHWIGLQRTRLLLPLDQAR